MPKTKTANQEKPKDKTKEPYQFKSFEGWPQKKPSAGKATRRTKMTVIKENTR